MMTRRFDLAAVILLLTILHALFVVTYPPNLSGDSGSYFTLLSDWHSSLVHAGGYPFFIGAPFHAPPARWLLRAHPEVFDYTVIIVQHGVVIVACAFMFLAAERLYGRSVALLAVLLFGANSELLGNASCFYPEWLQGSMVIASGGFAVFAFFEDRFRYKLWLYSAATAAFVASFLVKFNILPFGALLLVTLACDALPLRRKLQCAAAALMVSAVLFGAFIGFHRRSTGTTDLTYDKGWVLLTKLKMALPGNRIDSGMGLNTKRLLALDGLLPYEGDAVLGPTMFMHVDMVDPAVRAPYRARFRYLLTAEERLVDRALARSRMPSNFTMDSATWPVSHFIGLKEGNDLGVRVFWEGIRTYPRVYARHVWRLSTNAVFDGHGIFDTIWDYPFVPPGMPPDAWQARSWGRAVYDQRDSFRYKTPVLWRPGVAFFDQLKRLNDLYRLSFIVILLGTPLALVRLRSTDTRTAAVSYLLLEAFVLGFIVWSNSFFLFRWKELLAVLPLISVLVADAVIASVALPFRLLRYNRVDSSQPVM